MKDYLKLEFGRSINDHDPYLPKGRSACFDYGIQAGCDYGCPALWDGECPEPGEVVGKLDNEIEESELAELKEIYSKKI